VARVLFLICMALAAASAWLLRRAVVRQRAQQAARDSRIGGQTVLPAEGPFSFAATVTINALALLVFTIAALALLYAAVAPARVPERAQAYYPTGARADKVEGLVVLHCTVTPSWGVNDCAVKSETPPGRGFGASALQISGFTVLKEKDRAHLRPGAEINLPIRFKMPDERP